MTGIALTLGEFLLCAASTAVFVSWYFVFYRELPLRRNFPQGSGRMPELSTFAVELLSWKYSPLQGPSVLDEAGRHAVEALSRYAGDMNLVWAQRRPDGRAKVVAGRGGGWAKAIEKASVFDEGLLAEAAEAGFLWKALSSQASGLEGELSRQGMMHVGIIGWGEAPGSRGVVAAATFHPEKTGLDLLRPFLKLAGGFADIWAKSADAVTELSKARERLEGGLSSAIEELSQTHDRLIKKSREARALHDVASSLVASSPGTDSALGAVLTIIAKYLEADLAVVLLRDEDTGELVAQPEAYGVESESQFYRIPLSQDNASSVRVFKTGRPFMTGDAQNDPGVIPYYTKLWRIHSLMVVPICRRGRPIGVVRMGSRKLNHFDKEDLDLVGIAADKIAVIMETALLNRQLSRMMERLEALSRIKDEFVSTVSHEFKTPLTTVNGFLEVLLDGDAGPLTENQRKFLTLSVSAVKRLSVMVAELLDVAKIEGQAHLEMKTLSMENIITNSIDSHRPEAQRQGKMIIPEIPQGLPEILGDPRWLSLVVDNLITNALKFTHSGGRIKIEAREKGEYIMVAVEDDGIGIAPGDVERIFEKFYRVAGSGDPGVSGTGLGLAIARQAILRHGGRIWCESELGRGSRFHFVVPVAHQREKI